MKFLLAIDEGKFKRKWLYYEKSFSFQLIRMTLSKERTEPGKNE